MLPDVARKWGGLQKIRVTFPLSQASLQRSPTPSRRLSFGLILLFSNQKVKGFSLIFEIHFVLQHEFFSFSMGSMGWGAPPGTAGHVPRYTVHERVLAYFKPTFSSSSKHLPTNSISLTHSLSLPLLLPTMDVLIQWLGDQQYIDVPEQCSVGTLLARTAEALCVETESIELRIDDVVLDAECCLSELSLECAVVVQHSAKYVAVLRLKEMGIIEEDATEIDLRIFEKKIEQLPEDDAVEVANLTADTGLDLSTSTFPLAYAGRIGNYTLCKALLDAGCSPHETDFGIDPIDNPTRRYYRSRPPLVSAVQRGDVNIAKLVLDYGAKIGRFVDGYLTTPLHEASKKGDTEMVTVLIRYGAAVGARDLFHRTPLCVAKEGSGVDELLLKALDGGGGGGMSPALLSASAKGVLSVVVRLVSCGHDINGVGTNGKTPLHIAVVNGHCPIISYLIRAGAKTDVQDASGFTPEDLAKESVVVAACFRRVD